MNLTEPAQLVTVILIIVLIVVVASVGIIVSSILAKVNAILGMIISAKNTLNLTERKPQLQKIAEDLISGVITKSVATSVRSIRGTSLMDIAKLVITRIR